MARVFDYAAGETALPLAPPRAMPRSIERAISLIERSFAQPVTLAQLASAAGLSVSRFATLFRQEIGISPHRYVCLVRIRHAQQLLRKGVPPCAVANEVGFFDQSHLGKHFRRLVGVTPGTYFGSEAQSTCAGDAECQLSRLQQ
jgi:transcriptional regulator GlxA family with amidase domain